jgi:xanthine/uracil permease
MMISSIVISGIQLVTKEPLTGRNLSIVAVALGVGYGMGANTGILVNTPQAVQLIFGGSGIVPAALVAILLNLILPKDKPAKAPVAEAVAEKEDAPVAEAVAEKEETPKANKTYSKNKKTSRK